MKICPFAPCFHIFAWLLSALSGSGVSLVFCPLFIFLSVSPAASCHHPEILPFPSENPCSFLLTLSHFKMPFLHLNSSPLLFVVVQSPSCVQLCNPMDSSMPVFCVPHHLPRVCPSSCPLNRDVSAFTELISTHPLSPSLSHLPRTAFHVLPISLSSQVSSQDVCIQLCPTPCDPVDCSPPGSFIHGLSQARTLEPAAISSCRPSS